MYNKAQLAKDQKASKAPKKLKKPKDIITDPMGQWAHPGEITRIPSGNITMQGVPYPVLGIDNQGNSQMMQPEGNYSFPGSSVTEFPIQAKYGGWLDEYQEGGTPAWDFSTMKSDTPKTLPTAGTYSRTQTSPEEYVRAVTKHAQDEQARLLKEKEDREARVRTQIRGQYGPGSPNPKGLYDEDALVNDRLEALDHRKKIQAVTDVGMLTVAGLMTGAAAIEAVPAIGTALNLGFAAHGVTELPKTYRTLRDPNISDWEKFKQAGSNALDFAGAPALMKEASPLVKLAAENLKTSAIEEAYKLTQKLEPKLVKSVYSEPGLGPNRPTRVGDDLLKQDWLEATLHPTTAEVTDKLKNLHFYTNPIHRIAQEFKTDMPVFTRYKKLLDAGVPPQFVSEFARRVGNNAMGQAGKIPSSYTDIINNLDALAIKAETLKNTGAYANRYGLNQMEQFHNNLGNVPAYVQKIRDKFPDPAQLPSHIMSDDQWRNLLEFDINKYPIKRDLSRPFLTPDPVWKGTSPYSGHPPSLESYDQGRGQSLIGYLNSEEQGPRAVLSRLKMATDQFKNMRSGAKATPSTSLSTDSHPLATNLIDRMHNQDLIEEVNYLGHHRLNTMGVLNQYGIPAEIQAMSVNAPLKKLFERYPKLKGLYSYPLNSGVMAPYFEVVRRQEGGTPVPSYIAPPQYLMTNEDSSAYKTYFNRYLAGKADNRAQDLFTTPLRPDLISRDLMNKLLVEKNAYEDAIRQLANKEDGGWLDQYQDGGPTWDFSTIPVTQYVSKGDPRLKKQPVTQPAPVAPTVQPLDIGYQWAPSATTPTASFPPGSTSPANDWLEDKYSQLQRAMVKYTPFGDAAALTSSVPNTTAPVKEITEKSPLPKKDTLPQSEPVKTYYERLSKTPEGYVSYINVFDNDKGFNYVPTSKIGNAKEYPNVQHMAHFLYDFDMTDEKAVAGSEAGSLANAEDKKTFRANNPGSTVSDPFFTTYTKNEDGTVNVKYKKASTLANSDKIGDPLRQFRYSDINWEGAGKQPEGFNQTVSALFTKDDKQTFFIFPKGKKDAYGKFGGNSVIFLIDGKNVGIDFAGSVNQINTQAKRIIQEYKIKPDQLIIAYHDVGSYSAKPDAVQGKISSGQYDQFNTNKETGAGLAIPTNVEESNRGIGSPAPKQVKKTTYNAGPHTIANPQVKTWYDSQPDSIKVQIEKMKSLTAKKAHGGWLDAYNS